MASPNKASPSKSIRSSKDADFLERKSVVQLFKKAWTEKDDEWEKDELLDAIHWQRQLVAVACGLIWGFVPLKGFWAFAGYIAVNQAALFAWWRSQRIDEDEYGGTQALMGEGLPPSIGLFLFFWIVVYTALGGS